MTINIKDLKKKITYRASYRGNKEMDKILSSQTPGAILVRKNTFSSYNAKSKKNQNEVRPSITREDALCCLASLIDENNLVVSDAMIFRGVVVKQITFHPYRINLQTERK